MAYLLIGQTQNQQLFSSLFKKKHQSSGICSIALCVVQTLKARRTLLQPCVCVWIIVDKSRRDWRGGGQKGGQWAGLGTFPVTQHIPLHFVWGEIWARGHYALYYLLIEGFQFLHWLLICFLLSAVITLTFLGSQAAKQINSSSAKYNRWIVVPLMAAAAGNIFQMFFGKQQFK